MNSNMKDHPTIRVDRHMNRILMIHTKEDVFVTLYDDEVIDILALRTQLLAIYG